MNLQNRKKLIDLENELMVAEGQEEGWGKGQFGCSDDHVHTAVYKMDN